MTNVADSPTENVEKLNSSLPKMVSDQDLLRQFLDGDQSAFTSIVERHGPMILGVCQRCLRNRHDGEDAFQSTFLVLARQARRISKPMSLGSWLYGVAYRISLRSRKIMNRRQSYEAQSAARVEQANESAVAKPEISQIIDEELNRLPAQFRDPLVLSYLEGKTNEEVAKELGCPVGTIFSRLARGRERLQKQLTRRGVVLTTGMLATWLTENCAQASVTPVLVTTTASTASSFALGTTTAISPGALALANSTLKAMLIAQVKQIAMIVGMIAVGGGLVAYTVYDRFFDERSIATRKDLSKLNGLWATIAMEQGGVEQSEADLKRSATRMLFDGSSLRRIDKLPTGEEVTENLSIRLDPTQSPKAIDLTRYGRRVMGIYELNGNTLRLCFEVGPESRPTEFKTSPNSGRLLHVMNRTDSN